MRIALLILRAQLRALRNGLLHERSSQVTTIFAIIISLALGIWSASQLALHVPQWQAAGEHILNQRLWLLCAGIWIGLPLLTILSVRPHLGRNETLLFFTLPLPEASHFRSFYVSFLLSNLGSWLITQLIVVSYGLFPTLGWTALAWLLLLQLGIGATVLCALLGTLLFIRYLLPAGRLKARLYMAVAVLLLVALCALCWPIVGSPLFAYGLALSFGLMLIAGLGPLAGLNGRLYKATFSTLESMDRARRARAFPGLGVLQHFLLQKRSLTAALFSRAIASQNRNIMFWLRLLLFCVIIVLYPFVHALIAPLHIANSLFAAAYASVLACMTFMEVAPNAISGEGNRFTLYLSMPLELSQILRAKLKLFLYPAFLIGLAMSLFLSWYYGLSPRELGFAVLASALLSTGPLSWLVLGSTWDLDLQTIVEGSEQLFLQEEGTFTLRRIGLLNLGLLLFVAMLLLLWQLPALIALFSLLLLDLAVLAGMWRVNKRHIRGLLRRG
ncbi:hypothetical protein EPA93_35090 [Ktedonosporobacter rubrisoli]|uniref:Uncharacterized protein n=1 Tax=Ktedonosporobacter rubrisoli TaxID=2509675 RepID=A0A4P6JYU3_KTERU|nr:hypothetical protein [Ktedonosporobacter rubrisoli]QBD80917.1 hypothetical protein EPA93_35090 [Ktedonosporobacter rubrisoli]